MEIHFDIKYKEQQFRALYERYYAPFCLYARRFINNSAVCEDIISDVFASLWSKAGKLDIDAASTAAYIKMCVKNSCINFLRHHAYEDDYTEAVKMSASICDTGTPDNVYTLDELYRMLFETLEKLPENYRKVFLKTFMEGKKQEDIAQEMQCSVKSVNRYKQKTLELLRHELKDYLPLLLLMLGEMEIFS